MPGEGHPSTEVLFVGEGPGYNEDRQGRPFVGAAGSFLTELLGSVGWKRDEVFITNVVKCRPPDNRDPEPDEIAACAPFLRRQVEALDPALIVTLGRHSMGRFMPGARIGQVHGTTKAGRPRDRRSPAPTSSRCTTRPRPSTRARSGGRSSTTWPACPGALVDRARAPRDPLDSRPGPSRRSGSGSSPPATATPPSPATEPTLPPAPDPDPFGRRPPSSDHTRNGQPNPCLTKHDRSASSRSAGWARSARTCTSSSTATTSSSSTAGSCSPTRRCSASTSSSPTSPISRRHRDERPRVPHHPRPRGPRRRPAVRAARSSRACPSTPARSPAACSATRSRSTSSTTTR